MRVGISGKFGDAVFKARVLQCAPDASVDLILSGFCEPLAGFFRRVRSVRSVTVDRAAPSHLGHGEHVRWTEPVDLDTDYPRYPDQWCVNFVGSYTGCPPTTPDEWFGSFAYVLDGLPRPRFGRPTLYCDLSLSARRDQTLAEIRRRLPDFDVYVPDTAADFLDNMLAAAACVERLANFDGGMTLLSALGLSSIVDLGPRAEVNHQLFAVPHAVLKRSEEVFDYLAWRLHWRYARRDSAFRMGRRGTEDFWTLRPRSSAPRDVAVLTAYDDAMRGMGDASAENKRRYCARHGYAFVCDRDPGRHGRPPSWGKIPLILEHLPRHEWVFWSDADSVVMNPRLRLEGFLDDDYDCVFPEDRNGLNCGNFFVRNRPWALAFLEEAWRLGSLEANPGWWEQAAIRHLFDTRPGNAGHVLVVVNKLFNAYLSDGTYEAGDFLLHLPGYPGREHLIPSFAALAASQEDAGV